MLSVFANKSKSLCIPWHLQAKMKEGRIWDCISPRSTLPQRKHSPFLLKLMPGMQTRAREAEVFGAPVPPAVAGGEPASRGSRARVQPRLPRQPSAAGGGFRPPGRPLAAGRVLLLAAGRKPAEDAFPTDIYNPCPGFFCFLLAAQGSSRVQVSLGFCRGIPAPSLGE